MVINEKEKQVLQKYYAERVKSRVSNLKNIIDQGDNGVLVNMLSEIDTDLSRIGNIQLQWVEEHPSKKQREEIEDEYEK